MADAFSKLSSKSQTVIPRAVRERLGVGPGDVLRFRMTDRAVEVERVPELPKEDPFATFAEWRSEEDERLYRDL